MKESETRRDYLFLIKLLIYMLFDTFHILNVNVLSVCMCVLIRRIIITLKKNKKQFLMIFKYSI